MSTESEPHERHRGSDGWTPDSVYSCLQRDIVSIDEMGDKWWESADLWSNFGAEQHFKTDIHFDSRSVGELCEQGRNPCQLCDIFWNGCFS